MMKRLCILLSLLFLIGCITGCAPSASSPGTAQAPETTQAPEVTEPRVEAESLPDFTVQTIDGASFTLSEALASHELVLINLFATWCPPCAREFPYLQEAWSQRSDTVCVIALTVEPADTDEVLRSYADEKGLTFPIGSMEGTGLEAYLTGSIPTTILVDRSGNVASVEVGAKSSTQEFLTLFDSYTGEDYDPTLCTYTVFAYDSAEYDPVEGVVVNFCTDTACTPVTTAQTGRAVFTGPRASYHVQIVQSPEGWLPDGNDEWITEPYGQLFLLPFSETGE